MSAEAISFDGQIRALLAGDWATVDDPHVLYDHLRESHPVYRLDGTVVLSRHEDVRALVSDNRMLYSREMTRDSARFAAARAGFSGDEQRAFDAVLDLEFQQLVRIDPPEHVRLRRTIQAAFAPRRLMKEMEEVVRARLNDLLDSVAAVKGAVDMKRIAYILPLQVLGDLLGIPLTDLRSVHEWAHVIGSNKFNADSGRRAIAAEQAYRSLYGYIDELVSGQRASDSPSGLVATLLDAQEQGAVSHAEVRAMLALMIFAGHETTSNLIAIGTLELLQHPHEWQRVLADPSISAAATEELLRFVTPALYLPYMAREDNEISGVEIRAGDTVIGSLAAANRDPDVFERPTELDLLREDSRQHLSFGYGPHFCVGAALARLEGAVFVETLATRFPDVALAGARVQWDGSGSLRTPVELLVNLN